MQAESVKQRGRGTKRLTSKRGSLVDQSLGEYSLL